MNRYRIVDRITLKTAHVFAADYRTACLLACVPIWRASIYLWVWVNGEQTWERIEPGPNPFLEVAS